MSSGNSHPLPGPQSPSLHDDGLNAPAVLLIRGRQGVSGEPRLEAPAHDVVEQPRVGVSPGFRRGWASLYAAHRAEGSRVRLPGSGGQMGVGTCGRGLARREGLGARAPAPYRRWKARSSAPSGGRGWTPDRSAPPTAAAGNATRETARGPGGAARQRLASLAPPGRRVGRTLPLQLRAAESLALFSLVSPGPGSACWWQTKCIPAPPFQEGTNGRADVLLQPIGVEWSTGLE